MCNERQIRTAIGPLGEVYNIALQLNIASVSVNHIMFGNTLNLNTLYTNACIT